jgi:tetratricopeptide (TPR) repeat protein
MLKRTVEKEGTVKKVLVLLIIPVALGGLMMAQRPKPVYDPETKEGLLIQHIQQETDPSEKLHFMEQFAIQYPTNPMLAWVYDTLQPAYMKEKAWDEAMRVGEKRVELEPDNLDAAKLALKAAETKGNSDDIAKWADCTWRIAAAVVAKGGPTAGDAEQTKLYAESNLYSIAEQTLDPTTRVTLLLALQERNPKSPFAENIPAECIALYKQLNQMDKGMALAEQTLANDPYNVDILMVVSEHYFAKEDHSKVVSHTVRVIEVLDKKPRPTSLSEEEWQKKKTQMLGSAYYMGGISSSLSGQHGRADQMLRAAMPFIGSDITQEATVLYFLGLSNYKLADQNPTRAQDAVKYWRRCAGIKSNFQAQAMKNIDATRSEFNLP